MTTVFIETADTELSRLVDEVVAGEEVIIQRAGKPIARLVPVAPVLKPSRVLGGLAGQLSVPDNFDDPLPDDMLDAFEGR